MDWLNKLKYSVFLALGGLCVLSLGLSGGISIGSNHFAIVSLAARAIVCVVGALLVGVSIWLEFPGRTANTVATSVATKPRAQDVLHTLDDDAATTFPNRTKDCQRISIFARTAVNLLNTYQETFIALGKTGTNVRLLCVDPHSNSAKTIYGGSHQIFVQNARTTQQVLVRLKSHMAGRLEVRATRHAPTFGLTMIEREDASQNLIDVQLYFLHALTGRNRPILSIVRGDKWYNSFRDEFEALWNDAEPWDFSLDVSHLAETTNHE